MAFYSRPSGFGNESIALTSLLITSFSIAFLWPNEVEVAASGKELKLLPIFEMLNVSDANHTNPKVSAASADNWFRQFANLTAEKVGAPSSFALGVLVILIWMVSGPFFHFSDTWQLVINTGTTIITFLMVFLIQNTQTRDTKTMHLKLDELIRAVEGARNRLVDLEHSSQERIDELGKEFEGIREAESPESGRG